MTELTTERRNEIAWMILLHKKSTESIQLKTLGEYCIELSNEYGLELENNQDLRDFAVIILDAIFSKAVEDVWERKTVVPTTLSVKKRNEMAWNILIAEKFLHGLRIGKNLRRELGNVEKEIDKFHVSKSEIRAFFKTFLSTVYEKVMSNLQK